MGTSTDGWGEQVMTVQSHALPLQPGQFQPLAALGHSSE
jgi:hypothetical protein